ncbi:MAG: hypothetical protein Q7R55_01070 [Candidatus Wildermuthbacteria bacterium]|nr:hypothetical protein [Candidatus Wildermuthbacteria bacterium]
MKVQSGREFDSYDVRFVQLAVNYGFVRGNREPIFGTRAGSMTRVYIGGREDFTEHPDLQWLTGRIIASRIWEDAHSREDLKQQCLIGIPTVGTPLAQAAAMASYRLQEDNKPPRIIHHVMRESLKTHGMHHGWMNGRHDSNHTYWLLDNTVGPSAGSKFLARAHLQESGYPTNVRVLVLVDRQEGGIERMKQARFPHVIAVYKILDILEVINFLGLWPKEIVRLIQEEIKAHQEVV